MNKPKFPIIDAHTHFGPLVLGKGYTELYDAAKEVERFKEEGV